MALDDHLMLLDTTELRAYDALQSFIPDEELKDTVVIELLRNRRRRLSEAQRKRWPTINTNGIVWIYPFSIENQYVKWISNKMKEYSEIAIPVITEHMERWVSEYHQANTVDGSLQQDAYDDETDALINALRGKQSEMFLLEQERMNVELNAFAQATSVQNQGQFEKYQKVAIGTTFQPDEPWIRGTVKTWVTNNRSLLRGMTDEYIKKIEFNVASGFQDGLTSSAIIKRIKAVDKNMTTTRAKLLGRDQIGKLNGIYSKNRMQQSGLTMYVWLTALDERVRATHKAMENTVNKWNDASVVSRDNGKTFTSRSGAMSGATPGSQIQCRCTSKPFFDEIVGRIDTEVKE
jgi:SPP1 gp7 family putative phage head morphogenesis protein